MTSCKMYLSLYLCIFDRICLFPFCLCLGCRVSLERLLSNSRVAFDHQNRHHHHQMNIRTQTRGKTSLGVLHANTRHKYANTKTIDRTRWRCPTFLRLCPKCIWDQIQLTKPVSKHNFNPILCRWRRWRFWWSDATRLSDFSRSRPQAEPDRGVQWKIWENLENLRGRQWKIWNKLCFGRGPIWHREGYYLLKKFVWHHTSLNFVHTIKHRDPSAADSQVTTAVLTELFIFSTAHGNVEIYITVCTCFVKSFFCPLSLHSQFALSPATPKGTNVGAVDVFKGSLQFFCQNGQVLIAVLMNGQIRTQEATTYHAQFGNPPQSPISFCGRRTSGDVGMLSEHCSVIW